MAAVDASAPPRPHHAPIGGNALRAAVLGANDGLVSNLSLVMGVAGAGLESRVILITGLAGLLAGACSMAMGEWISVQSSRELYQRELAVERAEIARYPEEERQELVEIYEARGPVAPGRAADGDPRDGRRRARARGDGARGARHRSGRARRLGVDGGHVVVRAVRRGRRRAGGLVRRSSRRGTAVPLSLAASAVALFAIGAAITRVTSRSPWRSGLRQLAIGLAAAAVTYGTGVLLGVSVGA